ncbi:MAG: type II secretory pathway pseudopilin PulG [Myxococcota bacterium]|jgi:type II secretory pathway pseudopilin PulG
MNRSTRQGYSLLETVVAMAILVTSLTVLIQIQGDAVEMTQTAERLVTATQLAQEKMTEVRLLIEREGITESEMEENGDFDELGDDQLDLEFGRQFEDYHWEYTVSEIDLGLAGDLGGMADSLGGSGLMPGGGAADTPDQPDIEGGQPDLASLGVSNDMITDMLAKYIREIRVRVWWGDDSREAAERKDEVILTGHSVDPAGSFINLTQEGGAAEMLQ